MSTTLAKKPDSEQLFNEERTADLVVRWQRSLDRSLAEEILAECHQLIRSLICLQYPPNLRNNLYDDSFSCCQLKVLRVVAQFDPARGRLFSLLSRSLRNYMICQDHSRQAYQRRFPLVGDEMIENRAAPTPPSLPWFSFEQFCTRYWEGSRFQKPPEVEVQTFCLQELYFAGVYPTQAGLCRRFRDWPQNELTVLHGYILIRLRSFYAESNDTEESSMAEGAGDSWPGCL
jgi:hypothetical protein